MNKKIIGSVVVLVLIGVGIYWFTSTKEIRQERATEKAVAKVFKTTPKAVSTDKTKKAKAKPIMITDKSGKQLKFEPSLEEKEIVFDVMKSKKRPSEEELKKVEDFYNKAAVMWEAKMASLIFEDLKLGQSAMDKYNEIREHYQEHRLSFFDAHKESEEDKKEFAKVLNNVVEKIKEDMGVDVNDPNADLRQEDAAKIQEAMFKALSEKEKDFRKEHLNEIKGVLGDEGFKKYESMKDEYNNQVTEGKVDPLFNI